MYLMLLGMSWWSMNKKKKLITVGYAPLRETAPSGVKILSIPKGQIVELLDTVPNVAYSNLKTTWYKVFYHGKSGYAYAGFFDAYVNELSENIVDLSGLQTPSPDDAAQYILLEGRKKYNFCGQLSCAFVLGVSLKEIIDTWEYKAPNIVARIFKGNADRGTSASTLIGLLEAFSVQAKTVSKHFRDPVLGRTVFTLQRLAETVGHNHVILGVKIGRDGIIGHSGNISHWIAVDKVDVHGEFGIVTIYNPYNNKYEIYSWDYMLENMAGIDGVVVKAEQAPSPWEDNKVII